MTANRSSAVMQQRHVARDGLDDFPTPPWATRALCRHLLDQGVPLHLLTALEPCCNRGHMARPLGEYFDRVRASDVADYGWPGQDAVQDFLLDWPDADAGARPDWIVTNPPFRLAEQMLARALDRARFGVAFFVRAAFLEGEERYRRLFRVMPPDQVLVFAERVVLWQGVLLDPDVPVWDAKREKLKKPSSATAYAWLIWRPGGANAPTLGWIAPCRRALTRPVDYAPVPDHLRPPEGALLPDDRSAE